MKQLLITIAALVLVGCGDKQQSAPAPEAEPTEPLAEAAKPEPPTAKAPNIPIHIAAMSGNIEAVKQHITIGTDVNAMMIDGATPLDLAIVFKKPKTADVLRKHGGKYGSIQTAAADGNTEAVKEFLATGVDVNAENEGGLTPLHTAAMNGHKEIAELLIEKGADVNAKDHNSLTALDAAEGEIADLLRQHGGKHGTIHGAALRGNIEAVKEFLATGKGVNTKGDVEETPLHCAAAHGRKKIAALLIADGADVNAKEKNGTTPLDLAVRFKHPETVDLLHKHGAKTSEELKAEGK